jgi:hypothetical protein
LSCYLFGGGDIITFIIIIIIIIINIINISVNMREHNFGTMKDVLSTYILSWYQDHVPKKHCMGFLRDEYSHWKKVCGTPRSSFWSCICERLQWPRVRDSGSLEDLRWLSRTFPSFSGTIKYWIRKRHMPCRINFTGDEKNCFRSLNKVRALALCISLGNAGNVWLDTIDLSDILPEQLQTFHCEVTPLPLSAEYDGLLLEQLPYSPHLQHVSLGEKVFPAGPSFFDTQSPVKSFSLKEACQWPSLHASSVPNTLTEVNMDNVFEQSPLPHCPSLERVILQMRMPDPLTPTYCTDVLLNNRQIKHCKIICDAIDVPLSKLVQGVLSPIRDKVVELSFDFCFKAPKNLRRRDLQIFIQSLYTEKSHGTEHRYFHLDMLTRILNEFEKSCFPAVKYLTINLICFNGGQFNVVHDLEAMQSPQKKRWLQPFPHLQEIQCSVFPPPPRTFSSSWSDNSSSSPSVQVVGLPLRRLHLG